MLEPPAMIFAFHPVLADATQLIGVAVVVITFIGWMINLVNAQAKPGRNNPRVNRPPRPRSERIQSEIEQFMREQTAKRSPRAEEPAARRPTPPPRPMPPKRVAPRRPVITPPTQPPAPAAAPQRKQLGSEISERTLAGTRSLGDGLNDHVRSTMTERVRNQAENYLSHSVDAAVAKNLGVFSGALPPASAASTTPNLSAEILSDLRSGKGIQRMLIMVEILQKPVALRRRA
jgi:hypothetical protein